eukprot:TRINITY_DN4674_c0_g2_i1.p1 TRINITY_DN4674_c0_g2~~TRINITY_DN4674_c0_g2_i1.p1  ORF type:complete len:286 (-),score=44.20 TRINITY_DN4674_c0_g2_i1:120-977(-)
MASATVASPGRINPFKYLGLGATVGTLPIFAMYPMIFVKTQQQVAVSAGAFTVIRNTIRESGALALYRGAGPFIGGLACVRLAQFGTYDYSVHYLSQLARMYPDPTLISAMGALNASLISTILMVPFEVVSVQKRLQGSNFHAGKFMLETVKQNGVLAPFRGLSSALWCNLPHGICYFTIYSSLKRELAPKMGTGIEMQAVAGVVASGVAALVSSPLDTVRTRVAASLRSSGSVPSFLSVMRDLVRKEGAAALYRGTSTRLIGLTIGSTMNLLIFDASKLWATEY